MSNWKTGRGKLGFLKPLLGRWLALDPDTPLGPVECIRTYTEVLDRKFIRVQADWDIGSGQKTYQEIAHYGLNREGQPAFWSFTSDGGQAYGTLADVSDMEPKAMGFHADMPAGLARFGFWPTQTGMMWAADAQTKSGWTHMIRHDCRRI